jgi:hypothetical protein
VSLGVITDWLHKIDANRLFSRISAATTYSRIRKLTTNVVPDIYPHFVWENDPRHPIFPHLKEVVFDGRSPISNLTHGVTRLMQKRSPYRGRPLSTKAITSLMEMEQTHDLEFNFRGLNIVLWAHDTESTDPANAHRYSPDALRPFHDWLRLRQADGVLISVVQVDLFCPVTPDYRHFPLWWKHPDVYLNIRFCADRFADRRVKTFVERLVPTTRSLFISSFINPRSERCKCSPSGFQPRAYYDFFVQVVERAPSFQLEHLQNFPPLDHDFGVIVSWPPEATIFLDARSFQPLSSLATLTSLDLDFNHLSYGTCWSCST